MIKEPTVEQVVKMDSSMKIGHVSLNVTNLQSSFDFYQNILGSNVVGKPSDERVLLSADGASSSYLVELLQAKVNSDHDSKRAGLYNFAILLPERKYLADMLQNLRKNRELV